MSLSPLKPPFAAAPLSPAPATLHPGQKRLHLLTGVARSRTFPVQASFTPGVTRPITDAACIGHSMDGSDAQSHNSMSHIILAL